MIEIKESTFEDLDNIMDLWGNGEVMKYVGFPDGIHHTKDKMVDWLKWAVNKPSRMQYSIFENGVYCGETFYNVVNNYGSLDIKLLPKAMGRGIATKALSFAINKAFLEGNAKVVYVDPNPENLAAWALYRKLGFKQAPVPENVEADPTYQELHVDAWSFPEL